jgi:SAM-dependent methyltransferase
VSGAARPLVCPNCRTAIADREDELWCGRCERAYPVVGGIPVLLPDYPDAERRDAYRLNYERIAADDLEEAIVADRFDLMHRDLLAFIGDTRGKAVLDVGSAYGSYLRELDAAKRVAVDIALPYLVRIDPRDGVAAVCGDAEHLPVHAGAFDVIVISDVLEHLLEPAALVAILAAECRPDARIVVHVPWRESLEQYREVPYEYTHLRSFNEYELRTLFAGFDVVREESALPMIDEPFVFRLRRVLPRAAYNALVALYNGTELSNVEYAYRERWIRELPARKWLLRFFEPQVKLIELRRRPTRPRTRWAEQRLDAVFRRWNDHLTRKPAPQPSPRQAEEACR